MSAQTPALDEAMTCADCGTVSERLYRAASEWLCADCHPDDDRGRPKRGGWA